MLRSGVEGRVRLVRIAGAGAEDAGSVGRNPLGTPLRGQRSAPWCEVPHPWSGGELLLLLAAPTGVVVVAAPAPTAAVAAATATNC
jgi:hypothetical protein